MAKVPSNLTRVWMDEHALSGFMVASGLKLSPETPDVACFADDGPRRVVGNYDHSGQSGLLMDLVDDAIDDLVWNDMNTDEDHYLAQAFDGTTAGKACYERIVRLGEQSRNAKGGGAQLLDLVDVGSGGMARATILHNAAITTTANATGQNLGATASGTVLQVVYRVLAVSGTGSIVFAIEESQDDDDADNYAAISGLGATFSAVGVQRFTTTAATEAWKRLATTTFSGFTSVTALVTIGVVAGT